MKKELPPLWSHQAQAINKALSRPNHRFAFFFDPGTGKSRTVLEVLKTRLFPRKIIIFAPLNVCRNWQNEIALYLERDYETFLVSGQTKPKKLKILGEFRDRKVVDKDIFLICNIETLRGKDYKDIIKKSGAEFLIIDESHCCLDSATIIATPLGGRKIKDLTIGDEVFSISNNGLDIGRIIRKYSGDENKAKRKLTLKNGQTIEGLDDHFIRTPMGWRELGKLQISDPVSILQEDIWRELSLPYKPEVLQCTLSRNESQSQRWGLRKDEIKQSHEESKSISKNESNPNCYGTQAKNPRGEWETEASSAKGSIDDLSKNIQRLQSQSRTFCGTRWAKRWFPKLLQNRHCYSSFKTWLRDRRIFSFNEESETTRFEENKEVGISWVENIEIQESRSHEGVFKSYYDIEIDKFHNYIANGVIVHNCKSPNSLQTKGLLDIEKGLKPKELYLLTGTPAPQGEIDLWSTFYLLGQTKDNFFIWRKKNFDDKNERRRGTRYYWPEYTVRRSAMFEFQKLLGECSLSANKNEVLDLPPLLRTVIYAPISGQQLRHYETMEEFLMAIDSEGNELNASNVLTRTLRLQQILAGFLGEIPIENNTRLDALDSAIELTNRDYGKGEQFIIWTIFQPTYDQIAERLNKHGISHGFLTGRQSAAERFQYMEDFQSGKLRALIAHPKAGGVGVNLTAASFSIHYTRSYSLVDDLQAEARNYRGGSERHQRITRIDIVTPDTIDEDISTALREKKSIQDFILGLKEKHDKGKAKKKSSSKTEEIKNHQAQESAGFNLEEFTSVEEED